MKEARMKLSAADRSFLPCSGCDVDGTLMGQSHYERWMEYYQTDLVDCKVYNLKGKKIGEVATVYDFGAGVLLEVGEDLIQFNEENIKEVDIINKKIVKKI